MPAYLPWAVAAGAVSAMLYGSLIVGLGDGGLGSSSFGLAAFIAPYFAQAPLFLIGLWMGVGAASLAAALASVLLFALGGFLYALAFVVVNAAPAVFITRQALLGRPNREGGIEWYPVGQLLLWLVGMAASVLFALAVYYVDRPGGFAGVIAAMLERTIRLEGAPETMAATLQGSAAIFPGVAAVSWLVMVALNGAIAQGLLARLGRNLRPSPDIAAIELPRQLAMLALIACIGAAMPGFAGFLGVNLAIVLAAAYVFVGLGVVHVLSRRLPNRRWWLGAIYLVIALFGWPLVALLLTGLAEPWIGLRGRLSGGAPKS